MSDMAADYQVSVEIRVADADEARELEELFQSEGAQQSQLREPGQEVQGLAFIPIVIGVVIGASALVDIYLLAQEPHVPADHRRTQRGHADHHGQLRGEGRPHHRLDTRGKVKSTKCPMASTSLIS